MLTDSRKQIPVQGFYDFVWSQMPADQLKKTAYFDGLDSSRSVTYGQLKDDIAAFARGIRDPAAKWGGLKRRQIVCMFGPNDMLLPAIIFGIMKAGGGISPSNPSYIGRELARGLLACLAERRSLPISEWFICFIYTRCPLIG